MKKSSRMPNLSPSSRSSSILVGGFNSEDNTDPTAVQVLGDDGNDVTPLPLYHAEPGDMQSKPDRFFLDEISSSSGSGHFQSTSSFNVPSLSRQLASLSTTTSLTDESVPKEDIPINPPTPIVVTRQSDNVKQDVTEEMLGEVVDIFLSETDTISLLDIPPSTIMSEDADVAQAIKERNIQYAELCKSRMGSDRYVARSSQTFFGAPKTKQVQTDKAVTVDKGTFATVWDIYDCFCDQNEILESEKAGYPRITANTCIGREKRGPQSNTTDSTEMEMCRNSLNSECDQQLIMLSESFQHSLLVMERSILANILQLKLAAYRRLPILEDDESTVKPGTEEQGKESSLSPTLERLWAFSCNLTKGYNVTCMAMSMENPDILAVGYSDCDVRKQKPSLICCWSLKNITWPVCAIHCDNCVTSMDFSSTNPSQLAVGMYDGTVAIYNFQSQDGSCITNSSKCPEKQQYPVVQAKWIKQALPSQKTEVLITVSSDGRINKWIDCNDQLNSIELMELKKDAHLEKKTGRRIEVDFCSAAVTPGLCVDFHPSNPTIYLVGTQDGSIYECSVSDSQTFLCTYEKHLHTVNHIEWSPFSADVFLSCSCDWTVQLWKQGRLTPVLSFSSTPRAVYSARWSPNWPTVFAAINGQQVEVWDLNSSIMHPTIVHHAASGSMMTSLLFARGTDCVVLGDSDGQVTVYELKNLSLGEGKQVNSLEDIIHAALLK